MRPSLRIAYAVAIVALLMECLRLFYDVPSNDEPYYAATALLTSIGGQPFYNELSFQQTAFMLFEPLLAVYHWLFGTFAVYLFARLTFFVLLLLFAGLVFNYCRKRTDAVSAAIIPLISIAGINIMIGTLSYNTLGPLGLGAFAILLIQAVRSQSLRLSLAAGFFAFIAMAAYPTMVIIIGAHCLVVGALNWYLRRPFLRQLLVTVAAASVLLISYCASLLLRFGFDNILNSYRYTTGISALGSVWVKLAYSWMLFSGYAPWHWLTLSVVALWVWLWRKHGMSYIYLLVISGLFIASGIKPRPENGDWLQTWILLGAFLGAPLIAHSTLRSLSEDWGEVALWITGMVGAIVTCWTSGMTLYSTNYASILALTATLIIAFSRSTSAVGRTFLFCALFIFSYNKYQRLFTSDENIFQRTSLITWGPLAGFLTYERERDYYRKMQDDVDLTTKGARSILFYDEFASGYLMSDLYPATRVLCSHMINQSYPVRGFFRDFYTNPANRPDVIFRFRKHIAADSPYYWNVDPAQFAPAKDVFWYYLPDETGDYQLAIERENYSVYRKRSLPAL